MNHKELLAEHWKKQSRTRNLIYSIIFLFCYMAFFTILLIHAIDKIEYENSTKVVSVYDSWSPELSLKVK